MARSCLGGLLMPSPPTRRLAFGLDLGPSGTYSCVLHLAPLSAEAFGCVIGADLLPYLRGRREVRDRCGHDERVRVSGQIEDLLSQLFHSLDRMESGPRLDRIHISGHYGNLGAEPQSFAGHCEPHLPRGAVPDKTHAVYGLPGAASGHEQPLSAHRASETTE